MKKQIIALIVFVLVILLVRPAAAQMGMMGGTGGDKSEIDTEINTILKYQNIEKANDIDCAKVTDEQFEKLGDAWMDYQIGNKAMHERMDAMMGGEGSDQLKNSHIQMGKNYLGCTTNGGYSGMPMMYGYGNSTNAGNLGGMMGKGSVNTIFSGYKTGLTGVHEVLAIITWISAIVFLLTGIRYFWKNTKK